MVIRYNENPIYCAANEHGHIMLCKEWYFDINNKTYWIPEGYICDGASIPWAFWWIVGSPFDPENVIYAFPHDWLFFTHIVEFSVANEVLYQIGCQAGKRKRTMQATWAAVASPFGRMAWKNNAEEVKELERWKAYAASRPDGSKYRLAA